MSDDFAADDELRAMLSDLDPMAARVPVESATSPAARDQVERAMAGAATPPKASRFVLSRRKTWLGVAAGVAAIAIGTTITLAQGGPESEDVVAAPKTVVALQTAGGDPTMQMCMMFDVAQLRTAGLAFGGTVTNIGGGKVTLDVDRWFKGEPRADQVTIAIPPGGDNVALDGVEFEQGKRFLISATDGVLGTCGYSGLATTELEKSFEQAFPAAS